jgi:hypothetical protein
MLQERDDARIEALKQRLGARSKVEVVRNALDLLEREAERAERTARWRTAAGTVAGESRRVLAELHGHSRLRRTR